MLSRIGELKRLNFCATKVIEAKPIPKWTKSTRLCGFLIVFDTGVASTRTHILYHGTSTGYLGQILRNGLDPRAPTRATVASRRTLSPGYRALSPIRVIELIRFLSSYYGVESIFFREDNFMYEGGSIEGSPWKDVEEICRELRLVVPDIRWAIEARADNLLHHASNHQPRLEVLADAGMP
jgi:hypothetical protein